MKTIFYFSLLLFFSCTINRSQGKILIKNVQSNLIIRKLIRENRINGTIILNKFNYTKVDSFVNINVKFPEEQSYQLDSIYFLYLGERNYKTLAQSEFEKGLLYIEVNKEGNHTRIFNFGGYVTDVYNLSIKEKNEVIELYFAVDVWPSTMPDTLQQNFRILTNPKSIDFKFQVKGDNDLWVDINRD